MALLIISMLKWIHTHSQRVPGKKVKNHVYVWLTAQCVTYSQRVCACTFRILVLGPLNVLLLVVVFPVAWGAVECLIVLTYWVPAVGCPSMCLWPVCAKSRLDQRAACVSTILHLSVRLCSSSFSLSLSLLLSVVEKREKRKSSLFCPLLHSSLVHCYNHSRVTCVGGGGGGGVY